MVRETWERCTCVYNIFILIKGQYTAIFHSNIAFNMYVCVCVSSICSSILSFQQNENHISGQMLHVGPLKRSDVIKQGSGVETGRIESPYLMKPAVRGSVPSEEGDPA